MKAQRGIREKWISEKSDCLEYVNLMVDYFNYVNSESEEGDSQKD